MAEYTTQQTLLERLSAGDDTTAWDEFHDRYGYLIRVMTRRQGLQDADCDEIVQDVLTALSRALPKFKYDPSKGKFRSYLKTVTVRAIMARRREPNVVVGLEGLTDQASDGRELELAWESEWRQYHLRHAMHVVNQEFGATDRAAFDAYALNGKSAQETASMLGVSTDHVYQAKSRILKRLGMLIQQQVQAEG